MTREIAVAWAAGLFEGEGCMTTRQTRPEIHATVVSTDEDTVRRFAEVVGVGAIWIEKEPRARHKRLWRWQASGDKAEAVIQLLLPYLGERRTARALALLAMRDRWRADVLRERTCVRCAIVFHPTHAHGFASRQRYCSRRCQTQAVDEAYRRRTGAFPRGEAPTCKHGHAFTPENTHITPEGHRSCRACSRRRTHESRQRRIAA